VRTADGLRRVHQEDIGQALGIQPTHKYQNEGGPGIRDIVELLRVNSSNAAEDVRTFLDAIAFNWIIIGTDAHAKNYALLIGAEGRLRLAPLYDLASVIPYNQIDLQRVKLSMKLGGEYRFRSIQARHWRKQAEELKVDRDELVARVGAMAKQVAEAAPEIQRRITQEGLTHPLIHRLATRLATRAAACRRLLRA
jgi:serine/threonine-protein kinase HipA